MDYRASCTTEYLAPEAQKALLDRLSRIEGHVRAIRRMVEERRCTDEILIQVAAVRAALNKFAGALITHELEHCVYGCMEGEAEERLKRVTRAMATLLKQN